MDAFPGVPGGGHLRPLCGGSRCGFVGTAILGAVGFCDTRGGVCWLNMFCSHRYVPPLFLNQQHSETKKHRVVCVLYGWLLLFLRCFQRGCFFFNVVVSQPERKGWKKGPRLSFEVRLVYAVWCTQKNWTISFCAQDFLPGFLMERSWNM